MGKQGKGGKRAATAEPESGSCCLFGLVWVVGAARDGKKRRGDGDEERIGEGEIDWGVVPGHGCGRRPLLFPCFGCFFVFFLHGFCLTGDRGRGRSLAPLSPRHGTRKNDYFCSLFFLLFCLWGIYTSEKHGRSARTARTAKRRAK